MTPDDVWWAAPRASRPLRATVHVPGSKSETNRALVLAAIADGPGRVRGALDARDTRLMADGLHALGARITRAAEDGPGTRVPGDLLVRPLTQVRSGATIDCGLAGTVLRFLPPLAALARGTTAFVGDPAAEARPVGPVLDALASLGARVEWQGRPGFLPFRVMGTGRLPARGAPRDLTVESSASSQFLSALLLTAPLMDGPITLRAAGHVVSAPHLAMTVHALRARGVDVDIAVADDSGGALVPDADTATGSAPVAAARATPERPAAWTVHPGRPRGGDVHVDPDLSNAGPFLGAALLCGGSVTVAGWPRETTQAGDAWRGLLTRLGAQARRGPDGLTVTGGGVAGRARLRGLDADLSDVGELTPTLAALTLFADSPSHLSGIAHLRGHETDRLAALAREITRLGGDVTEHADGLEIRPRPLHAARVRTYGDHRMATFGALVGLVVPGVEVQDIATTAKTLPGFPHLWAEVLRAA